MMTVHISLTYLLYINVIIRPAYTFINVVECDNRVETKTAYVYLAETADFLRIELFRGNNRSESIYLDGPEKDAFKRGS